MITNEDNANYENCNKETNSNNNHTSDKSTLLKAIELVLADSKELKREVKKLSEQYYSTYSSKKSSEEINKLLAKKIISNYSYFAAFVGGASGLTGIIPGLGTVVATFGGATADAALCMKYQIEMTMALAVVYGHDIEMEEEKRLCFIIAGLGAINEAAKEGGKALGTKAFIKMSQQYLKGATLQAVKGIFKKIGIDFTRKALVKAAPFGIGVIIGASANKGLTTYVGNKALDFFASDEEI